MKLRSTKFTSQWLALLPLISALAACGGSGSDGQGIGGDLINDGLVIIGEDQSDLIDNGQEQQNSNKNINTEIAIIIADGDITNMLAANPLVHTDSTASQNKSETQLHASAEVEITNVKLDPLDNGFLFSAKVTNMMSGIGMHNLRVVASNNGSTIEKNYLEHDAELLVPGDSQIVRLTLPSTATAGDLAIGFFSDTAPYIIYDGSQNTASSKMAPQLRTSSKSFPLNQKNDVTVSNFDELENAIRTASIDVIIGLRTNTFTETNDDGEKFDVNEDTIYFPRKININKEVYIRSNPVDKPYLFQVPSTDSPHKFFTVTSVGKLVLMNIELRGAHHSAITNYGELVIAGSSFIENSAPVQGGAISNLGTLTIVDHPTTQTHSLFGSNDAQDGGAIYNQGILQLHGNTKFINNAASNQGGAILNRGNMPDPRTTLTGLTSSGADKAEFRGNTAEVAGGAISNVGQAFVVDALFKNNEATSDNARGGAIHNGSNNGSNANIWIEKAIFEENISNVYGGGIYSSANMFVHSSQFKFNVATDGGAIYTCGNTQVQSSLVTANTFPERWTRYTGAGVSAYGTCPAVVNIIPNAPQSRMATNSGTASKNFERTVTSRSAGTAGTLELIGVTIWDNHGTEGQYGTGLYLGRQAYAKIRNSIIAMNTGGDFKLSDLEADEPTSIGLDSANNIYSYINDNRFIVGAGDQYSNDERNPLDPLLTLDSNGWAVPSNTSVAIGTGDCSYYDGTETDSRGEERESGYACDIGAAELTDEEQEQISTKSLIVHQLEPVHPWDGQWVKFPAGEDRLWVNGTVDTAGLVELRVQLNKDKFVIYDLSKLLGDNGDFTFPAYFSREPDSYAMRPVADGMNFLTVEAEYNDGSVISVDRKFYAEWEEFVQYVDSRPDYTGGAYVDSNEKYSLSYINGGNDSLSFSWWDTHNKAPANFTIGLHIDQIRAPSELEYFAYRINDREPVHIGSDVLRPLRNTDGSYDLDIPVNNLNPGINMITYGTLYDSVRMSNRVLHFEVE